MRITFAASLGLGLALAAGGCGGGGAAVTSTTVGPQVVGQVVSRHGQPVLLGGIEVECLNDGVTVTTDADGAFTLDVPGGIVLRVRFTDPLVPGNAFPDLLPCGEGGDESPDASDLEDDVVELPPLADGEICVIEVEIAGGRVVEYGVNLPAPAGNAGPFFHGEGVLVPLDPHHPCASGEVEVVVEGDCAALEVEAAGLEPGAIYGVTLISPSLEQAAIGAFLTDADGEGHLRLEACTGEPLPFGVAALEGLAGYALLVVDLSGVPALAGQVPGRGHEYGEPGHPGGGDGALPFPGDLPPLPDLGDLPPLPDLSDVPPLPDFGDVPPDALEDLLDLLDTLLGGGGYGFPGLGG